MKFTLICSLAAITQAHKLSVRDEDDLYADIKPASAEASVHNGGPDIWADDITAMQDKEYNQKLAAAKK